MIDQLPTDRKPGKAVVATAATAIGTAAIGGILLQVFAFRIIGDIITSVMIFGFGYASCWLKNWSKK